MAVSRPAEERIETRTALTDKEEITREKMRLKDLAGSYGRTTARRQILATRFLRTAGTIRNKLALGSKKARSITSDKPAEVTSVDVAVAVTVDVAEVGREAVVLVLDTVRKCGRNGLLVVDETETAVRLMILSATTLTYWRSGGR